MIAGSSQGDRAPVARRPVATYPSPEEDPSRWDQIGVRAGDVVVSSRSKHGTTWTQAIIAMLLHGGSALPAPLRELSPWVDWQVEDLGSVRIRLDAQPGRRVLKTHTPLDGIPMLAEVTYVVPARHPLDAAISLYHQGFNLDRERIAARTGGEVRSNPAHPLDEWLRRWIAWEGAPAEGLDSLPGVLHHVSDAHRLRAASNVVLVHYDDLCTDLAGEVARLAHRLRADVDQPTLREIVDACRFEAMASAPDTFAPDHGGALLDRGRFFRRGASGAATDLLEPADFEAYRRRCEELVRAGGADRAAVAWLHRESPAID